MSMQAIGIFDSGVGGLSVMTEIRALLPAEHLMYVADSGFAPYGDKSRDYIVDRCEHIVRFFLRQQVKAIVVACNTATSMAVDQLRTWCPVPIVAMEPAIKPAVMHTQTGVVGVLATTQTIGSSNVNRLIAEHGKGIKVLLRACSGFVEQVEQGDLSSDLTKALVAKHVNPLLSQGADTLVLGCTHYPFLKPMIEQVAGVSVKILDPSAAIARQLQRKLIEHDVLADAAQMGQEVFFSTGDVAMAEKIITLMWGVPVKVCGL